MKLTKNHWLGLLCAEIAAVLVWMYIILVTHPNKPFSEVLDGHKWIGLVFSIFLAAFAWGRLIFASDNK